MVTPPPPPPPPSSPQQYQELEGQARYKSYLELREAIQKGQPINERLLANKVSNLSDLIRSRSSLRYLTGERGMAIRREVKQAEDLRAELLRERNARGIEAEEPVTKTPPKPIQEQKYPFEYNPATKTLRLPSGEVVSGVESFSQTASGELRDITVRQGGKQITYEPTTGKVRAVQDQRTYFSYDEGVGVEAGTGRRLDPFKGADYERLRGLGVQIEIPKESLGQTDFYYKQLEQEAGVKGAKGLASSISEKLKPEATGYLLKVTETPEGYLLEATEGAAKQRSYLSVVERRIAEQSVNFPYAVVEQLGEGKYLIRQIKPSGPEYLSSKAFGTDFPSSISLTEKFEPKITFRSGAEKTYSQLTPIEKEAFDVNFTGSLSQIAGSIGEQISPGQSLNVRFEKEGGAYSLKGLPTEKIGFSAESAAFGRFDESQYGLPGNLPAEAYKQIAEAQRQGFEPTGFQSLESGEIRYTFAQKGAKETKVDPLVKALSGEARTDIAYQAGKLLEKTPEPQTYSGKTLKGVGETFKGMEEFGAEFANALPGAQKITAPIVSSLARLSPGAQFLTEENLALQTEFATRFTGSLIQAGTGAIEAVYAVPVAGLGFGTIAEAKIRGIKDTTPEATSYLAAQSYTIGGLSSLPRSFANLAAVTIAPGAYIVGGGLSGAFEGAGQVISGQRPSYKVIAGSIEAGGISSVVSTASFQAVRSTFNIAGTGGIVNYAKRVLGSAAVTGTAGATYSAVKDVTQGQNISSERLRYYGLIGIGVGAGLESARIGFETGFLPKPGYGKVQFTEKRLVEIKGEAPKGTEIYKEGGKTYAVENVPRGYSGVYVQRGEKVYPIAGLKDYRPSLGQPTFKTEGLIELPSSQELPAFQTQILKPTYTRFLESVPNLPSYYKGYYQAAGKIASEGDELYLSYLFPKGQEFSAAETRFKAGFELMEYGYYSPKVTQTQMSLKEVLEETPRLQAKGAPEAVIRIMEREKAGLLLSGSTTQKIFMGGAARTPHDIDLHIISSLEPEALAKEFYEELAPVYGKGNIMVSEGSKIYVKQAGGQFEKLIEISSEFQPAASPSSYSSTFGEGEILGYGLKRPPPFVTKEGFQIYSFEEQAVRKGESAIRWKSFGPAPESGRLKDVGDFLQMGEYKATVYKAPEKLGLVKTFRSTIPEEVQRSFGQPDIEMLFTAQRYYAPSPASAPAPIGAFANLAYEGATKEAAFKPYTYTSYNRPSSYSPSFYQAAKAYKAPTYEYSQASIEPASYSFPSPKSPTYSPSYKSQASPAYSPSAKYSPSYSPSYRSQKSPAYSAKFSPKYSPPYSPSSSPAYSPTYSPEYSPISPAYSEPYSPTYSPPYSPKYSPEYYNMPPEFPVPPQRPETKYFGKPTIRTKMFTAKSIRRGKKTGERTLFADLLSVAQSQFRYGKATHLSPYKRRDLYEYEKDLRGRVPTVETLKTKTGKSKAFKGIKWVDTEKLSKRFKL